MNATTLSDFLSQKETLAIINANFHNPIKKSGATLVVEPTKGKNIDFGAVGTAFDYWLRCEVKPSDPDLLDTFLGYRFCRERYMHKPVVLKALNPHLDAFTQFFNGTLAARDRLLAACLFLAKFETEYRSGYPVDSFEVRRENVNELGRIADATDLSRFKTKNAVLNPTFSAMGSKLHIKADADVIVDGVLVELKSGSTLAIKDNLRQLIGYWILNGLRIVPLKIKRLAVYYPRFKYFIDFPVADLMNPAEEANISEFFKSSLGKNIRTPEHI